MLRNLLRFNTLATRSDKVVLASHPDQPLSLLLEPSAGVRRATGGRVTESVAFVSG
jgi:predicted NAD/FAD-binding protein